MLQTISNRSVNEDGRHTQRKPRHDELADVISQLHMQKEQPDQIMATPVDARKVHDRVQTGSKRTIEPSSSLTKELGGRFFISIRSKQK